MHREKNYSDKDKFESNQNYDRQSYTRKSPSRHSRGTKQLSKEGKSRSSGGELLNKDLGSEQRSDTNYEGTPYNNMINTKKIPYQSGSQTNLDTGLNVNPDYVNMRRNSSINSNVLTTSQQVNRSSYNEEYYEEKRVSEVNTNNRNMAEFGRDNYRHDENHLDYKRSSHYERSNSSASFKSPEEESLNKKMSNSFYQRKEMERERQDRERSNLGSRQGSRRRNSNADNNLNIESR